ncbi:hypothetical protein [Ferrimonas kyonanensis]|uniref:hypothetical protein n=1 Tax=Ferrimonas kyonanensis TaxID=364763 RepID=UPI000400E43A|nr:hypothetical protein [Ferrimonas kyonanensis]
MRILNQSLLLGTLTLTGITGCSSTIHEVDTLSDTQQVISVDAKQRFLISGQSSSGQSITCTEPSPDVFSVYSSAVEANVDVVEEVTAAFKSVNSENGATIGIRSQSIQLLRDAGFRLCEAYASGAIDESQYFAMLSKYQRSMVALIAIEQLTTSQPRSQIAIAANATLNLSDKIADAKANKDQALKDKAAAETTVATEQAALDEIAKAITGDADTVCTTPTNDTKANCDKYSAQKTKLATAKSNLTVQTVNYQDHQKVFDSLNGAMSMATNTYAQALGQQSTTAGTSSSDQVALVVKDLAESVLLDEVLVACTSSVIASFDAFDGGNKNLGAPNIPQSQISNFIDNCMSIVRQRANPSTPQVAQKDNSTNL